MFSGTIARGYTRKVFGCTCLHRRISRKRAGVATAVRRRRAKLVRDVFAVSRVTVCVTQVNHADDSWQERSDTNVDLKHITARAQRVGASAAAKTIRD